jgi:hypothetical protein
VAEALELTEGGDLLELVAALLIKIFFELRLVHRDSFGWMLLTTQYMRVCDASGERLTLNSC